MVTQIIAYAYIYMYIHIYITNATIHIHISRTTARFGRLEDLTFQH